jgi:hypothetical protein
MWHIQRVLGISMGSTAALLLLAALPQASGEAVDGNRELLEKYKQDPAHYARLQQDLLAFRQLGAERQEALRKLDRDFQDETPGMRDRLQRAMRRYVDWLEQLPEAERQAIDKAPDRKTKLQRIREIREQQWVRRLPKAQQEQLASVKGEERSKLARRFWDEEWEQRADWQVLARSSDLLLKKELPTRLDQLPDDVKRYVTENLVPLLSKEEERRLQEAQGKWPRFMRALVDLIDNHPISVLGPIGPTRFDDPLLPRPMREHFDRLEKEKGGLAKRAPGLYQARGKWPEFGVGLLALREAKTGPGRSLDAKYLPARPHQFPEAIQVFLDKRLLPALDEKEQVHLKNAVGQWPAYPQLIVELARKHNLPVPLEKPLPGSFEFYDRYRVRSVTPEIRKSGDPVALAP